MMQNELVAVLTGQQAPASYAQPQQNIGYNQSQNGPYGAGYVQGAPMGTQPQQAYGQPQAQVGAMWMCQNCGTQNSGNFCQGCGSHQPQVQAQRAVRCDKCGWMLQPGAPVPKFCPQCGDPIDFRDM